VRICFDLDGVICALKQPGESYADLRPLPGAKETMARLRAEGHTIIIHTARHMKTCGGDVSKVIARQGKVTLDWLERHGIEFDEILFGKPYAHVYVDDNAFRFSSWEDIGSRGEGLPSHRETQESVLPMNASELSQ